MNKWSVMARKRVKNETETEEPDEGEKKSKSKAKGKKDKSLVCLSLMGLNTLSHGIWMFM